MQRAGFRELEEAMPEAGRPSLTVLPNAPTGTANVATTKLTNM